MATYGVASFSATIGAFNRQGDLLPRLTVGVNAATLAEWSALAALQTTRYAVLEALNGSVTVDIRSGAEAVLTIAEVYPSGVNALLIDLVADSYLPSGQTTGRGVFLITGAAP